MKIMLRAALMVVAFGAAVTVAKPSLADDYRGVTSTWTGATAAPAQSGDDIRNASSALWGVGG
jgi:hypothetical protein